MKRRAEQLPTQIDENGVKFRTAEWSGLTVAHVCFPKGADAAPLLTEMPEGLCQVPHWGYVIKGSIHVRFADGREEIVRAGDAYYWPPGHTVRTDEDYEAIEFSPAKEMNDLVAHLSRKLKAA